MAVSPEEQERISRINALIREGLVRLTEEGATEIPGAACTRCGYEFELASGVNGVDVPHAGSLSLCVNCGNIDIFTGPDDRLRLRAPNDEELQDIMSDPAVRAAVAAVLDVNARRQ